MKTTFTIDDTFLGPRLQELRVYNRMNLKDVCAAMAQRGIEISPNGLNRWELNKNYPNAYQFLALCDVYGVRDLAEITGKSELNEEGMIKLADYRKDLVASGRYTAEAAIDNIIPFATASLAASAGTGNFLDEGSFTYEPVPESEIPEGADFRILVAGDSMEPAYHDGDYVYVQQCTDLRPYEVGIFILNGSGYIKLLGHQKPEDPEAFTDSEGIVHDQPVLISLNPRYAPIIVKESDSLTIAGRVL